MGKKDYSNEDWRLSRVSLKFAPQQPPFIRICSGLISSTNLVYDLDQVAFHLTFRYFYHYIFIVWYFHICVLSTLTIFILLYPPLSPNPIPLGCIAYTLLLLSCLLYLCNCVCVCMHTCYLCMCVCACVSWHTWGGQQTTSGVSHQHSTLLETWSLLFTAVYSRLANPGASRNFPVFTSSPVRTS